MTPAARDDTPCAFPLPAQHCKWYETSGACPFGEKCRFIHRGEEDDSSELAGPSARTSLSRMMPSKVSFEAAFVGGGSGAAGGLPGLVLSCHSSTRCRAAGSRLEAAGPTRAPDGAWPTEAASPRSPLPGAGRPIHSVSSGGSSSSSSALGTESASCSSQSSRRASGDAAEGAWSAGAAARPVLAEDWNPISGGFPNPFIQAKVISATPSPPAGLGPIGAAAAVGADSVFGAIGKPTAACGVQQPPVARPVATGIPLATHAHGAGGFQGRAPPSLPLQVLQRQLQLQRNKILLERLQQLQEQELPRVLLWQQRELQLQQMMHAQLGPGTEDGGLHLLGQQQQQQQQLLF